jgi:hypothetical protein
MHRLVALFTFALLLSPLAARSQDDVDIVPGSRIRITERGARSDALSGTVITMRADSVVMRLDNNARRSSFALAGLSRFEVSEGKKGHANAGGGIGFLIGAGIGALIGSISTTGGDHLEGAASVMAGSGIGAVVGTFVGAAIGAKHKTEKWVDVEVESISISAGASRDGGGALSLGMHF